MGAETDSTLADASKGSDPGLHDDLCARVQRVSGAPFFAVGDVPKVAATQLTALAARENPSAAEVLQSLRGWDWPTGWMVTLSGWPSKDSSTAATKPCRHASASTIYATRSGNPRQRRRQYPWRLAPARLSWTRSQKTSRSLDGHYVRLGTAAKKSDLESMVVASASGRH